MEKTDWFENWFDSPYYKILYQNRDMIEASSFVDELIYYLQPIPGSKMLDIACGEGRFSIQLAEKGFDVTGIDLSENSIRTANASANEHLQFFVHDMRMPFYINYFDFAFNFFTSFGYFEHSRDNQLAAKSFAASLKKGGILVVDYLNKDYVLQHLVPEETIEKSGILFNIKRWFDGNHIIKDIDFTDAQGQEHRFTEHVSAFELKDFVHLFNNAGMSLVGTFGNYELNPYQPLSSPRLIMIFKKV